jgi:hypothetical protein
MTCCFSRCLCESASTHRARTMQTCTVSISTNTLQDRTWRYVLGNAIREWIGIWRFDKACSIAKYLQESSKCSQYPSRRRTPIHKAPPKCAPLLIATPTLPLLFYSLTFVPLLHRTSRHPVAHILCLFHNLSSPCPPCSPCIIVLTLTAKVSSHIRLNAHLKNNVSCVPFPLAAITAEWFIASW